jgi:MFS family permease
MQSVANKTHRNDQLRAPFLGILETGWSTFALVIAIRYFDANETVKAWITGAGPMGFLLAPLSLYLGAVFKLCAHQVCALLFTVTAILLGMAASVDSLGGYCLTIVLSQICAVQCTPFMLKIFADNYAPSERGRRMSRPFMLTATCAIAFSIVGGALLDRSLHHYPILFATMALSGLFLAYVSQRFESQKITLEAYRKSMAKPQTHLARSLFWLLIGSMDVTGLRQLDHFTDSNRIFGRPQVWNQR